MLCSIAAEVKVSLYWAIYWGSTVRGSPHIMGNVVIFNKLSTQHIDHAATTTGSSSSESTRAGRAASYAALSSARYASAS